MRISILTLFPGMFIGPFDTSIMKHAQEKSLVTLDFVNIRDFGVGKHKIVDDTPYGGGIGMVMRVDVLHKAIESSRDPKIRREKERVILLSADGQTYTQTKANEYTHLDHIILICGHYEGIDARIKKYIDEEISIGDFVLTGGEIPAMAVMDSVVRLIPGVLPQTATESESFSLHDTRGNTLLEFPTYTRPQDYDGQDVPDVLRTGNHKEINTWRQKKAEEKTALLRPDLLTN